MPIFALMKHPHIHRQLILLCSVLCIVFSSCGYPRKQPVVITSPDNRLAVEFVLNDHGEMFYSFKVDDSLLIDKSRLGFVASSGQRLSDGFTPLLVSTAGVDSSYTMPWGENKEVRNRYNEMRIPLKNDDGGLMEVIFRVFDDGMAFRYAYETKNKADSVMIKDELTSFRFTHDALTWSIPANGDTYELLYRKLALSKLKDANTPITFKFSDSLYVSLHEAALTDFPEMTLKKDPSNALGLKAELIPLPDGTKARMGASFVTPWRSIIIGRRAIDLPASNVWLNLNEPSKIKDTSWIKPMKYVGIWWGMHLGLETWTMDDRHGATTENAVKYIDFAADNDIQAVLFEGWNEGWENWGGSQHFCYTCPYADFNMDSIVNYAQSKNIQLIGHHETGGNIPYYESVLDSAFAWYAARGVNVVKTGYAGAFPGKYLHHSQYGVRHYRKVVETAAKYKIMIDAHEPIKDTGIRKTYPNMMTREGARGMEWNAWSEGNPPEHQAILAFTRLLSGPMDYTPGIFDIKLEKSKQSPKRKKWNGLDKGNSRVNSTLAKQIANWVVLYSPLQMAADQIENYQDHPAFRFFKDYDTDIDSSYPLAGEPGEFYVVARRAKDRFFLGAITNEKAKEVNIPLNFLEKGVQYTATRYMDTEKSHWRTNPLAYEIVEETVDANSKINIMMAPGGGQAITFIPINQ